MILGSTGGERFVTLRAAAEGRQNLIKKVNGFFFAVDRCKKGHFKMVNFVFTLWPMEIVKRMSLTALKATITPGKDKLGMRELWRR